MLELAPGTVLGAYVVTERIGRGGMASVYQAHHPALDRDVAIKVLWDSIADQAGFIERFRREARSASRLRHPNILTVYDFGEQDGTLYMVTELLTAGRSRTGWAARYRTPRRFGCCGASGRRSMLPTPTA